MPLAKLLSVDARVVLPLSSAHLFGNDPTHETPDARRLMDLVPGAEQIFVAGQLRPEPVLDLHLEGPSPTLAEALRILESSVDALLAASAS